jgi:hypothetical protein
MTVSNDGDQDPFAEWRLPFLVYRYAAETHDEGSWQDEDLLGYQWWVGVRRKNSLKEEELLHMYVYCGKVETRAKASVRVVNVKWYQVTDNGGNCNVKLFLGGQEVPPSNDVVDAMEGLAV